MHAARRFVLAASVVVAVAACGSSGGNPTATTAGGGGSTASTGGGTPAPNGTAGAAVDDPCSLLTQAEVSTVLGQQVGAGDNSTDSHECDWQYPADGVPKAQASITIETGSALSDVCDSTGNGPGFTVTAVSGIGDGACFTSVPGLESGDNLTFAAKGHVFTVTADFGSKDPIAIQAADEALARAALAHLGG
jgi:hypothetical protein